MYFRVNNRFIPYCLIFCTSLNETLSNAKINIKLNRPSWNGHCLSEGGILGRENLRDVRRRNGPRGSFMRAEDVLEMSYLACLVPPPNVSNSCNYFVNVIIPYTCNYKKITLVINFCTVWNMDWTDASISHVIPRYLYVLPPNRSLFLVLTVKAFLFWHGLTA